MSDPTRYLNSPDVAKRYSMSLTTLWRLQHHIDPDQRFPPPSQVIGHIPLWTTADLDAWDTKQIELSKGRQTRRFPEPYMGTAAGRKKKNRPGDG